MLSAELSMRSCICGTGSNMLGMQCNTCPVQGLVVGTAASGAVISLLRCITKGALPATPSGLHTSAGAQGMNEHFMCLTEGTGIHGVLATCTL